MACNHCKTDMCMIESDGGYVCTNCGLVSTDVVFDDKPYFDKQTDAWHGTWNNVFISQKTKRFNATFDDVFAPLNLPDVIGDNAKWYYTSYTDKRTCQGQRLPVMTRAFIGLSLLQNKYAIPFDLVCGEENANAVRKAMEHINRVLGLNVDLSVNDGLVSCIYQYAQHIGVSRQYIQAIIKTIPLAAHVFRKIEIKAAALVVISTAKTDKDTAKRLKDISSTFGIAETSIKVAIREINTE